MAIIELKADIALGKKVLKAEEYKQIAEKLEKDYEIMRGTLTQAEHTIRLFEAVAADLRAEGEFKQLKELNRDYNRLMKDYKKMKQLESKYFEIRERLEELIMQPAQ